MSRIVVSKGWGREEMESVGQRVISFSYAQWLSHKDLLYSMVPIVIPVSYTYKFVKSIALMLCSYH